MAKRKLETGQLVWIRTRRNKPHDYARMLGSRINYFKISSEYPVAGTYLRRALAKDFSREERKFIMSSGRSLARGLSEKASVVMTAHGLLVAGDDLIVTRLRRRK
jgi:hypothetical protein